ncbi:MAG: hypothetical protein K2G95_06985, partial [Muribaculaceae bacterium]|nr:hypothetical protein [Muribaculaceae bacterium]
MLPVNIITSAETTTHTGSFLPVLIICTYFAGAAFMLLRSAYIWLRLWRIVNSGRRERIGQYTLVITETGGYSSFGWLRYIVISEEDYLKDRTIIVSHEMMHLRLGHPIDMILAQISIVLLWYTPAPYILRNELRSVHEYQADMAVISSGVDMRSYQLTLIKKAVGKNFPALANSLNHSKLKKRITMMMKNQSDKTRRMRALTIAPALALAIVAVNTPTVAHALKAISNTDTVAKSTQIIIVGKSNEEKSLSVTGFNDNENTNIIDSTTVITIDGRRVSQQELSALDPSTIKSMSILNNSTPKRLVVTLKNSEEAAKHESVENSEDVRIVAVSTIAKDSTTKDVNESIDNSDVIVEVDGRTVSSQDLKSLDPATISSVTVLRGTPSRISIDNSDVIVEVDGRTVSSQELKSLDPATISSVTVLRGTPSR